MSLIANAASASSLLANEVLFDSIRKSFAAGPNRESTILFLAGAAALVLLLIAAWRCLGRYQGRTIVPRVDYLTAAVDLLGLSESDRRDLQRIARIAKLDQPAAILLAPEILAMAAAPALASDPTGDLKRRLDALSMRLFDTKLPTPKRALASRH